MGIFNSTCCPSKPKRTIDYILNWIDKYGPIITKDTSYINDLLDWRRSIEIDLYDHVKDVADEYITNYDWSEVPQFDVLSRSIATKADKTIPVAADSIALLDVNGNLKDSGVNVSHFAPASHAHSSIVDTYSHTDNGISVDNGGISISVDNGESSGEVDITAENIGNLHRALQTPDNVPTENSDNFVTSGGIKTALDGKAPANYVPWRIEKTTPAGTSRVLIDGEEIEFFIEDVTGDDPREVTAALNFDKMPNFARALEKPDNTPRSDSDRLITSGAVYEALRNLFSMDIYTINYYSVSSGHSSVTIANGESIKDYETFIEFISDNAGRIVSVFLTHSTPNDLSCLATLVIGEEGTNPTTGNSYWSCKLLIGNMEYECNVQNDQEAVYSIFELQS